MYKDSWSMVGNFFVLQLAAFAIYLLFAMFPGMLFPNSPELKVPVQLLFSALLNLVIWWLFFAMARNKGLKDQLYGKAMKGLLESHPDKPLTPQQIDKCFRPLKGFLTAGLSCLPFLAIAILALTLPPDTMLGGIIPYEMVARVVNMQYAFFFGDTGLNWLPAVHPVLPLINPLIAGVGYIASRKRYAVMQNAIETSYQAYRKKQRREKRRLQREEERKKQERQGR